ncbi:hypothetical protein BC830DRAFT_443398 [Chytriomyces sp. MP71]|nr:hypothetical protein BC830DRAFT_443398 [Chytriomyces sp. MP71]
MEAVLPTTLFSFSFGPPGNFNPSEYGASDVLDEPVRVRTRHGAKFLDLIPQSPPSLSGSCSTSTTDEETSSPSDLETRFKGDLLAEKLSALLNKTDSQKLLRIPIETGKDGTDSETTSSDIASESAASMKLTLDHRRGSLWVPGRDDTEELNPGEQRTLFGEIGFMSNFLMHQVSTLTSGVASFLWKGVARPSWDSRLHVTLHWLRNQLNFAEHSIQRARQFSQQVDLDYQPKGCKVISRHFSVARRELLRFEAEALRIHKKFRYPIPPEVDERGEPVFYKDYCLDGEWLLDEGWKESMGATKKVILYIHGGAFCLGEAETLLPVFVWRQDTTYLQLTTV